MRNKRKIQPTIERIKQYLPSAAEVRVKLVHPRNRGGGCSVTVAVNKPSARFRMETKEQRRLSGASPVDPTGHMLPL